MTRHEAYLTAEELSRLRAHLPDWPAEKLLTAEQLTVFRVDGLTPEALIAMNVIAHRRVVTDLQTR